MTCSAAVLRAELQDLEAELGNCDGVERRRELWWKWLLARAELEQAEQAEHEELVVAVRGARAVERAVQHYRTLLALDALGHFLRLGAEGPPMFDVPERARRAA